jgi:magnesium transporter
MKLKLKKKVYKTLNLPPGTMTYKGKKQSEVTTFEVINYNKDTLKKYDLNKITDVLSLKESNIISWININGLNNLSYIEQIGAHYNIHPLTLEDIVNTMHRPKIDEFENYLFVVFKMIYFSNNDDDSGLIYEHISMVVGKNYLLTFQESDGDVFNDLRDRMSNEKGRIRNNGSDYLMFAILDAIVDNYLTVIEAFGDKIEDLETRIFESDSNSKQTPGHIQELKREILKLRRSIFPIREVVNRLEKIDCEIIDPKTHSFLRDLYDHILQVSESIDLCREMVWNLMDMHMSIMSNKMNEVMKVLTIIATIFIPLTFIAGIYGMNFDNIPELHYKYGYHILWGVMITLFILMLIYFRRKKWL